MNSIKKRTASNNRFFVFSCLLMFLVVLWDIYYSKIANYGPRSYCNTFQMLLGTLKIVSKSGPVEFLIITNMVQNIQEQLWNHPGKYYLCKYGTQTNWKNKQMYFPCTMLFLIFCISFLNYILRRCGSGNDILFHSIEKNVNMNFIFIKKHEMDCLVNSKNFFYFQGRGSSNIK